ncbi:MAG: HK97 gp10 family phage protein [Microbacterium sp.]
MEYKPILSEVEKAAQDGMRRGGREMLKRARELAPKDDGDLRRSGKVVVDDMSMSVRFTAPHAVFQHEHLDWEHDGGGGAKFLEIASDEIDLTEFVAAAVEEALGG